MAFTSFYLDGGTTFNPQNFRASFKDGVGIPSLFLLKLKRYPSIFFKGKESSQSVGGLLGSVGGIGGGIAKLTGLSSVTNALNTKIPTGASSILNIGELLYNNFTGRGIDDLKFKINKVQLPEKALQTYSTRTYGPLRDFPREIENSTIGFNVLSGGTYVEHELFSSWIDNIAGHDKLDNDPLFNVAYYDDIITEAELVMYNEDGEPSYICYLNEVYPRQVGGITLDWDSKNQISQFSVVLNFRVMKTEKIALSLKTNSFIGKTLSKII